MIHHLFFFVRNRSSCGLWSRRGRVSRSREKGAQMVYRSPVRRSTKFPFGPLTTWKHRLTSRKEVRKKRERQAAEEEKRKDPEERPLCEKIPIITRSFVIEGMLIWLKQDLCRKIMSRMKGRWEESRNVDHPYSVT